MGEERSSLALGADGIKLSGGTSSKAGNLREYEPHPVALLPACPKFRQRYLERDLLGIDEALKLEGITHIEEGKEGWPGINGPRPAIR